MKIRSIDIKDFKGIDSLKLDFVNPYTDKPLDTVVLAGPNGCGKTSVLEAILLCTGNHYLLQEELNNLVRNNPTDFLLKSEFSCENDADENKLKDFAAFYSKFYKIPSELEIYVNPPEFGFIPDSTSPEGFTVSCNNESIKFNLGPVVSGRKDMAITYLEQHGDYYSKLKNLFIFEYFETWRYPELPGPLQLPISGVSSDEDTENGNRFKMLKQYLVNDDVSERFGRNKEFPWERFYKIWQSLIDERLPSFEFGMVENKNLFEIFVRSSDGSKFSIDQLSSGEIELFTFFGWLLKTDYSNAIILIEEPELHLHPQWHRAIMKALREALPDSQIIITTHSPEIVNSVYSYERFYLVPQEQLMSENNTQKRANDENIS